MFLQHLAVPATCPPPSLPCSTWWPGIGLLSQLSLAEPNSKAPSTMLLCFTFAMLSYLSYFIQAFCASCHVVHSLHWCSYMHVLACNGQVMFCKEESKGKKAVLVLLMLLVLMLLPLMLHGAHSSILLFLTYTHVFSSILSISYRL